MTSWPECNTRAAEEQGGGRISRGVHGGFVASPVKDLLIWVCGIPPFRRRKRKDGAPSHLWRGMALGAGLRLFGVEDDVKEEQAGGGENDVVAEEHFDPKGGIAVAGEDVGGGLDHGLKSGNEDGKEDEGEKKLAAAAADGERGEEDSVDDEGPCA